VENDLDSVDQEYLAHALGVAKVGGTKHLALVTAALNKLMLQNAFKRQIVESDLTLLLQFSKSCLRCCNISEWAKAPKCFANKFFFGIIQQVDEERVNVGYQSRVPIKNQYAIWAASRVDGI
jgi:hypothetical protein